MARKIDGRVLNQSDGSPVAGARVQAWDADSPDSDDYMGMCISGSDGRYKIDYTRENAHWDPAPHNVHTWRPDIYLTVDIADASGQWIRVKRTAEHTNHKLRNDLHIDIHVNPPPRYARTVYGYVTWRDTGRAIVSARVTAYDQDTVVLGQESQHEIPGQPGPPGSDNSYTVQERLAPMGSASTDINGYYEIHYAGGRWDFALPGSTWWRPDILIKVVVAGHEQRSSARDDVPHHKGVRIDMSVIRAK